MSLGVERRTTSWWLICQVLHEKEGLNLMDAQAGDGEDGVNPPY